MSAPAPPLLDAEIRIDHLPPDGRQVAIVASAEQRQVIAERLGISAVERLEAKLAVTRFRGGLRVLGRIEAVTVQPCIVSFVPVPQQIDEPLDRIFLPAAEQPAATASHPEVFVDLEADDLPDYFDGPVVDLSEAVIETVALALDPYPRAEGATLEGLGPDVDDGPLSPFAGLKSLIDPDDDA